MRVDVLKEEDYIYIKKIHEYYIKEGKSTFRDVGLSYEEWLTYYLKELTFVLKENNEVIGFSSISKVSSRPVYSGVGEVCIYIHPNHIRKGAGRVLLKHTIKASEENGFWTINSNIFTINYGSIKLHEECGFKTIGIKKSLGKDIFGEWRDVTLMEIRSEKIF